MDGVQGTVEMPDPLGATCGAVGTTGSWVYTFDFTECNVGPATGVPAATNPNDPLAVLWWTYSVYLNYDHAIDRTVGNGNLLQMDQVIYQLISAIIEMLGQKNKILVKTQTELKIEGVKNDSPGHQLNVS